MVMGEFIEVKRGVRLVERGLLEGRRDLLEGRRRFLERTSGDPLKQIVISRIYYSKRCPPGDPLPGR